jgi:hypothetical protein
MVANVEIPIVEAAPQDAHDDANTLAQPTVVDWRSLPQVHKQATGKDVGVGVVDTRVGGHPWFAGQVQGDPVVGPQVNDYTAGHATFIAGLVLQQAPAARVAVSGALDAEGHATTDAVIAAALQLAQRKQDGEHEVDILNLSLGCYGSDAEEAQFGQLFKDLWAENEDLIVVAAAGNSRPGEARPFIPGSLADHERLVSVGAATDLAGTQWAPWSNQTNVTFRANGTGLVSTFLRFTTSSGNPDGRWARWGGTSFSTAVVSGLVAARMAPGDGSRMSGTQAVAALLGGGPRPVSLPSQMFPTAAVSLPLQVFQPA